MAQQYTIENTVEQLLVSIEEQQVEHSTHQFQKGLFKASRYYPYLNLLRPDNNIFFTALITRQLLIAQHLLSGTHQEKVSSLIQSAVLNYKTYRKDMSGFPIYQFWPIEPNAHFPNGLLLHRFKKFKSPPDADDTALIYLTKQHTKEEILRWRTYLNGFSNGVDKWNKKVPQKWNWKYVYGTWMGTGAMPVEFDIVVMTNILSVFAANDLAFNENDNVTLDYISALIKADYYLKQPFFAAPWYPNPITILYHLVTFFATYLPANFVTLSPFFEKHYAHLKEKSKHPVDFLLLAKVAICLKKKVEWPVRFELFDKKVLNFPFYIGGMLTAAQSRISWYLAKYPAFHWQFRSPALMLGIYLNLILLVKEYVKRED